MDNQNNGNKSWIAWTVVIVIIVVGVIIWVSTGTSSSTSNGGNATDTSGTLIHTYGPVTLSLGQQAGFDGITIKPLSIASDSRCAQGNQCVQAGTVSVVVESDLSDGTSQQNTITLGAATTTVGAYTVALDDVEPQPTAGQTIASTDYRLTFEVHQAVTQGTDLEGKG